MKALRKFILPGVLIGFLPLAIGASGHDAIQIGAISASNGSAAVIRYGRTVGVETGKPVMDGDTIVTGDSWPLIVRLTDGSTFTFGQNSEFRFTEYEFDPVDDPCSRGTIIGLRGGLRLGGCAAQRWSLVNSDGRTPVPVNRHRYGQLPVLDLPIVDLSAFGLSVHDNQENDTSSALIFDGTNEAATSAGAE